MRRKTVLTVLCLLISTCTLLNAQQGSNQIAISSFTVKTQLPGNIDEWATTPGSIILVAQTKAQSAAGSLIGPKLVVQIKSGGAILCGNGASAIKSMDDFNVRNFQASEIVSALGQCKELKEGNYTLCVQFFNMENRAISQEMCREFSVRGEQKPEDYSSPTLINPENGKQLSPKQSAQAITFRWTPIVPKPKEPVTYRLKVWQLMQGQNGTQAMRTNQPVVTKDVDNLTQATVSGIYTGPCRPPYLCDFIWTIEALNREGKPMGNKNTSEAFAFSVTEETGGLVNVLPENKKTFTSEEGKKEMLFRWTPLVPKPNEPVTYRLKVWQLMQGQNGTQAMRTNKPIVTKDVTDITEATVSGIYTGPCRPPYLCDFIWNVEAVTREGKVTGSSEPSVFKMNSGGCIGDLKIDSVKCTGVKDGKNIYRMCVTYKADANNTCAILFNDPQNASLNLSLPSSNINNIIYSFTAGTAISNMAPPIGSLPATITAGNSVSICFDITANVGTNSVTIGAFGLCNDGMQNTLHNTGNDLDSIPLPPCECNPCRDMNVGVDKDSLKIPKSGNPSQLNLTGMFTGINNNLIKKITAEIIYFDIQQTKDKECAKCVFDSKQYGNFLLPATPLSGYSGPVLNKPDYSRLITWNSIVIKDCSGQGHGDGTGTGLPNDGKLPDAGIIRQNSKTDFGGKAIAPGTGDPGNPVGPINGPPKFGIPISVPDANALSCCGDVIKICIRYTFYDFCCHTCEVIKCYEIKREK